ncbi:ABC transporter ATP-binding protein/permease [Arthrobacter sp. fls2-241-R2A-172]|uniref:ABC transporter ATP-binding protein/permease n=1 Tax=Arthrobacter sp. fls2-241-R2A-172 TaxID=3040325 RepID=UPI00254E4CE5|nr:ABC transporter ATP-binding protein/permease [Arthrobacter sp. fls2-241-R2A-172]
MTTSRSALLAHGAGEAGFDETLAISLAGVSRTYPGGGPPALSDVSLAIQSGEFVSIVGPSGSGKSTLLNIMGLLDRPSSGRLVIRGQAAGAASERNLDTVRLDSIGFVFQSSNVIGDQSVISNAAIGLRVQGVPMDERAETALDALEFVGLEHKRMVQAKLLSGGERQRLAIARAIATHPQIILADEPTGNLDSDNGQRVIEYLRKLNSEGVTVIIITHDLNVANQANRRIEIQDGRITSDAETNNHPRPRRKVPAHPAPFVMSSQQSWASRIAQSLLDDWGDALTALSARTIRTTLLILAFAIAIGGMTGALGISSTTSNAINTRLAIASQDTLSMTVGDGPVVLPSDFDELRSGVDRITRVPHVVGASYVYSAVPADVRITRVGPSDLEPETPLSLHSSSKNYFDDFGIRLIPDNSRTALDNPRAGPLAIVSTKAAKALDIPYSRKTGPVEGASIWIDDRLVPVIGVFDPGPNFPEYANSVFVDASIMRAVSRTDLKIQVRTEKGFSAAIAQVAPLAYSPSDPGKAQVDVTADIQSIRQGVSNDLGSLIALLSLVLMLLAVITAASSMYLTVQNRSAEVALRRAIGSSRWLICRSFILEGFIVGITAGLLGGIIGTMTTLGVSWIQSWPPVLPSDLWLVGILLGTATGIVSAIYPAWVASRKDPAIAIRG